MKEILSWDKNNNKDCFGLGGKQTTDHVWPISKGGSNSLLNKLTISDETNKQKPSKTKGKINGHKFAVRREVSKDGVVYGVMMIRKLDSVKWVKIIDIKG